MPLPADINVNEASFTFFGGEDEAGYANIKTAIDGGLRADSAGAGAELGYSENTSFAALGVVTGVTVVVPPTVRPILVHWNAHITSNVAADTVYMSLRVDGVATDFCYTVVVTANGYCSVMKTTRLPASAVARTLTLFGNRSSGTGAMLAISGATFPIRLGAYLA